MMDLGEYKEQEFTADVPDYSAVEWRMENEEDEEVCLPREGFCVNDDEDCFDCREFWLDFHAEGLGDD